MTTSARSRPCSACGTGRRAPRYPTTAQTDQHGRVGWNFGLSECVALRWDLVCEKEAVPIGGGGCVREFVELHWTTDGESASVRHIGFNIKRGKYAQVHARARVHMHARTHEEMHFSVHNPVHHQHCNVGLLWCKGRRLRTMLTSVIVMRLERTVTRFQNPGFFMVMLVTVTSTELSTRKRYGRNAYGLSFGYLCQCMREHWHTQEHV